MTVKLMKINFDVKMLTLKGKEIPNNEKDLSEGPVTLNDVGVNALLAVLQEDKADGREKQKRYNLAKKISKGGNLELKPSEISVLVKQIPLIYGPLIIGQAYELLGEANEE